MMNNSVVFDTLKIKSYRKFTHFNTSEKCRYSLSGSENAISSSSRASSTDAANLKFTLKAIG